MPTKLVKASQITTILVKHAPVLIKKIKPIIQYIVKKYRIIYNILTSDVDKTGEVRYIR